MRHTCCDMVVIPNDIIRFKSILIDGVNQYEGKPEEAIKTDIFLQLDSALHCRFPFKGNFMAERKKERFIGHFAQAIELYDLSTIAIMAVKSCILQAPR